jgi:hypothetical protein
MIRAFCAVTCAFAMAAADLPGTPGSTAGAQTTSAGVTVVRGTLVGDSSRPFGEFNGVPYTWHNGYFEGESSRGRFRVLYVLIAPAEPSRGNGTVLFEPPHPDQGPAGRDVALGREFLFSRGFSYAGVGWSNMNRALLNPAAPDMFIGGEPVVTQALPNPAVIADEEILLQFAEALTADTTAARILGPIQRRYAYGVSSTTLPLLELQRRVASAQGSVPFDLTLLHGAIWGAPWPLGMWEFLDGPFEPITAAGRVMIVQSEGDLFISDAKQFRRAGEAPTYRIYEVAGASHLPSETNPLDHSAVMRALLIAGDAWVRSGVEPPPSSVLNAAPGDEVDAQYGRATGIARDSDLNALGGIRLPDLAVGRARFIASDMETLLPGFPPQAAVVTGSVVDLACQPVADDPAAGPRFKDSAQYQRAVDTVLNELKDRRLLLDADITAFRTRAAEWSFDPCNR